MKIERQIISDSMIYGIGLSISKGIVFFSIPIFTRIFNPTEYGIIDMLNTIAAFISLFMTMGLDSAQSYYFMEAKNTQNHNIEDITASMFQLKGIIAVVFSIFVLLLIPILRTFFFDKPVPSSYFFLIILMTVFNMLISQNIDIFRLTYKPWKYNLFSLIQSAFSVGLALIFILLLKFRISGYFWGYAISSIITFLLILIPTRKYRKNTIQTKYWKGFLLFGFPLLFGDLAYQVMMGSDKWFVMNFLSSNNLGIYSAAINLSLAVALIVISFRQAWWPHAMDLLHQDEGDKKIAKIGIIYLAIGLLIVISVFIISPLYIKLMAPKEYYGGWKIIGIFAGTHIFYGFYLFSSLGIFKANKTYMSIIIFGSGAIINIILNYFFIRSFGIIFSAFSTFLSILISNAIALFISNKFYKVRWNYSLLIIVFLAYMTINLLYITF